MHTEISKHAYLLTEVASTANQSEGVVTTGKLQWLILYTTKDFTTDDSLRSFGSHTRHHLEKRNLQ